MSKPIGRGDVVEPGGVLMTGPFAVAAARCPLCGHREPRPEHCPTCAEQTQTDWLTGDFCLDPRGVECEGELRWFVDRQIAECDECGEPQR